MSFKAQKWAWEQDTKSPLSQLLLFTIAHLEHDEKGYSWASHQYLADKCKCKRRALIDNLAYLEREQYITVERRQCDGMKQTNLYRVNYSRNQASTDVQQMHIDAQQMHKGSAADAQGGSAADAHKQITSLNRLINTTPEASFDQWYAEYPIKKGRKTALTAWLRAKTKPTLETMLAILQSQKEFDDNWLRDFIPHPTTYLNQERWNDEIQQPKREELTESDKYAIRQQRNQRIIQTLDDNAMGLNVPALPPAVDEDKRRDWFTGIPGLVS